MRVLLGSLLVIISLETSVSEYPILRQNSILLDQSRSLMEQRGLDMFSHLMQMDLLIGLQDELLVPQHELAHRILVII